MVQVGDIIHINFMSGEPDYEGREGVVRSIDSLGQLHGSWGGLAVIPGIDNFSIIARGVENFSIIAHAESKE